MNIREFDIYEILREILFPNENDNTFILNLNIILAIIFLFIWIIFTAPILLLFSVEFEKKSMVKEFIIINGVKDSEVTSIILNKTKNNKPIYLEQYDARIIANARRRINYIEQIFN